MQDAACRLPSLLLLDRLFGSIELAVRTVAWVPARLFRLRRCLVALDPDRRGSA